MEELLGNDMVYQHRLEQANESVNHYLAEELEIADKKRKLNSSKTAIDELAKAPPPQMQRHHRRRQQGTRLQKELRGRRRTNFFQMQGIDVNNQRG